MNASISARKMVQKSLLAGALLCLGVFVGGAAAQPPVQYQSPYGPTMAPELNYFRRDAGALSNYQTFVRPQRQLQSSLRSLQYSVSRQGNQLQNLQGQLAPAPTGTHATFQNFSHFYTMPRRR